MIKEKTCQAFILITQLLFLYIRNADIKSNQLRFYDGFTKTINSAVYIVSRIVKLNKIKTLEEIFIDIITHLGIYFQINDDYINLTSPEYFKKKGVYDDIYEKKFSFIIIYIINNKKKGYKDIIKLFAKETLSKDDVEQCIKLIYATDSIKYTKKYLGKLKQTILYKSIGYFDVKWFFDILK